jgi:hypothetical protein
MSLGVRFTVHTLKGVWTCVLPSSRRSHRKLWTCEPKPNARNSSRFCDYLAPRPCRTPKGCEPSCEQEAKKSCEPVKFEPHASHPRATNPVTSRVVIGR